jgi:hypothetical protein
MVSEGHKEPTRKFKQQRFGPYGVPYCFPNNTMLLMNINHVEPKLRVEHLSYGHLHN